MTQKQLQEIKNQLPAGERFDRAYGACEGGIRVITKDKCGREIRYKVIFHEDDSVSIQRF